MLSDIFFLIVLLFFTVADAGDFASKLEGITPRGQRLAEAFRQFAHGSRQYLAVATIFGAIVATCDVVALWILDIRYAWLWGLLAFITNYIPNIGFIIGLLPPTIIALLDHDVVDRDYRRHCLLCLEFRHPDDHPAASSRRNGWALGYAEFSLLDHLGHNPRRELAHFLLFH